jgi:hypothetical protein
VIQSVVKDGDAGAPGRFIIHRAEARYEWRGDRLILKAGANGQARLVPYTPPKDLFFTLAQLPSDQDAILDFADRFGALGLRYRRNRNPELDHIETLGEWREAIDTLKQALTLWKALRDGDQETLRTLIKWDRQGAGVVYDTHADTPFGAMSEGTRRTSAIIASKHIHPDLLAAMAPGDAVAPARAYLTRLVNENAIDLVRPQLRLSRELDRFEFRTVAYGVLGAAWLQLAESIDDDARYRQCANPRCGEWMVISREHPQGKRPTRRTCSDACRVMLTYLRELEAVEMKREGMTVTAIAKKLDADPAAIKRWIQKRG